MRTLIILAPLALFGCDATTTEGCDPTGGTMCLFLGKPGEAMLSPEDIDRRETATYLPVDGEFGPDGTFYFLDFNNHRIRHVRADDTVETLAGTGFLGDGPEGPGLDAAWNHPTGLAFNPNDDTQLYVAAWHNSRINVIDLSDNSVRFECGTGARDFGGDGADAHGAFLDLPSAVAFDDQDNLYIMDQANQVVRRVDPFGVITTIAGKVEPREFDTDEDPSTPPVVDSRGWAGYAGDGGPALEARFQASVGQAADPSSHLIYDDGMLYMTDTDNHLIRVIDLAAGTVDRVAGYVEIGASSNPTVTDPVNLGFGFADGDVDAARFHGPRDLAMGKDGTIYVADTENSCVRAIRDGMVSTFAGVCDEPGSDDEGLPASESHLFRPYGVAVSPDGSQLIIADTGNHVFRVVGL